MMRVEALKAIRESASNPSMPEIANRCTEITREVPFRRDMLVEALDAEPDTAARVLSMANSPLLGGAGRLQSLGEAIEVRGAEQIRQLVLAGCLVKKLEDLGSNLIAMDYHWRLALTTGILASKFAEALAPHRRKEALLGGLLSDLGVIIMARVFPERYAPVVHRYQPHEPEDWIEGERQLMGITHAEVSAIVLERWGFSAALVTGVKHHHACAVELAERDEGTLLARIIGGAAGIAMVLSQTSKVGSAVEDCRDSMEGVELDLNVLAGDIYGIEEEIVKLANLLEVEVLSSKVFNLICTQLIESIQIAAAST